MTPAQTADPAKPVNGGFPQPLDGEPVRVVAARHRECGATTRVRLPATVPARAVRRVECSSCTRAFAVDDVEELQGVEALEDGAKAERDREPGRSALRLPRIDPSSRLVRIASVPVAAAAVIGGLMLIRGGEDGSTEVPVVRAGVPSSESGPAPGQGGASPGGGQRGDRRGAGTGGSGAGGARLIRRSSFALALPARWEQVKPPRGATFAARARDRGADATLWVSRDPKLDFPTFISRSLEQLQALAGSAEVVERIPAPTAEETIVRLAAQAPADQPHYEVTLRVAGPYRYYLATTVEPDASATARAGAELIANSFTPAGAKR